jgi:hypothetical protein
MHTNKLRVAAIYLNEIINPVTTTSNPILKIIAGCVLRPLINTTQIQQK